MKTVADEAVRRKLVDRLLALDVDSSKRWGTLTPHEMLCHLGDASSMVLRTRPRPKPITARPRPVLKFVALWTPLRWPHGRPTNPSQDPRVGGTRPTAFENDRARAIAGIEGIGSAMDGSLEPVHGLFGAMTTGDWQRWAYKHTDHHLRQFGL